MVVYRALTDFLLIHLFLGPKPKEVMKQLTSVVGRLQKAPSKLALGYFVCRQSGGSVHFKRLSGENLQLLKMYQPYICWYILSRDIF